MSDLADQAASDRAALGLRVPVESWAVPVSTSAVPAASDRALGRAVLADRTMDPALDRPDRLVRHRPEDLRHSADLAVPDRPDSVAADRILRRLEEVVALEDSGAVARRVVSECRRDRRSAMDPGPAVWWVAAIRADRWDQWDRADT